MIDGRNYQGKFGQDYVRVLASAAGLLVYTPDLDYDGIDLMLRWPARVGAAASPALDIQVKSWSDPRGSGGLWQFGGLNEKQFNKLAGPDYTVPRALVIVIVPREINDYADVSSNGMLLRHQAYYHSLRQERPITSPSRTRHRVVQVPVGNVLTVRSLRRLVHPDLVGTRWTA